MELKAMLYSWLGACWQIMPARVAWDGGRMPAPRAPLLMLLSCWGSRPDVLMPPASLLQAPAWSRCELSNQGASRGSCAAWPTA